MGGGIFQFFTDKTIEESGYYGPFAKPLPPKAPPKVAAPPSPPPPAVVEYNITLGVIDGSIVDLDTMDTIKTRWHLGEPLGGYAKWLEPYYEIQSIKIQEDIIKIQGQRKQKQIEIEHKETISEDAITMVNFDLHSIVFKLN